MVSVGHIEPVRRVAPQQGGWGCSTLLVCRGAGGHDGAVVCWPSCLLVVQCQCEQQPASLLPGVCVCVQGGGGRDNIKASARSQWHAAVELIWGRVCVRTGRLPMLRWREGRRTRREGAPELLAVSLMAASI